MELYRKTGVNPMAGCLPALLQMPILYAMFRFFPSNIDLRGQSFLVGRRLGGLRQPARTPLQHSILRRTRQRIHPVDGGVDVRLHAHDHGQPKHASATGHARHEDHSDHHAVHDAVLLQWLCLGFELVLLHRQRGEHRTNGDHQALLHQRGQNQGAKSRTTVPRPRTAPSQASWNACRKQPRTRKRSKRKPSARRTRRVPSAKRNDATSLLFLLAWVLGGRVVPPKDTAQSAVEVKVLVGLQRTPCFGRCPVYEFSRAEHGRSHLEGGSLLRRSLRALHGGRHAHRQGRPVEAFGRMVLDLAGEWASTRLPAVTTTPR